MAVLSTLLIGSVIASAIGAIASGATAAVNANAQKEANKQNVDLQRETNAQNQYNIEHAHQIEVEDLKAAGLNPVLSATGGQGAPIQSLNSPKVNPVQMDLSGIGSALQIIPHMMSQAMMMEMIQQNNQARNETLAAIAKGHDSQSAANAALRAQTLNKLYQRKAEAFAGRNMKTVGENAIPSAKHLNRLSKNRYSGGTFDKKNNPDLWSWERLLKELGY